MQKDYKLPIRYGLISGLIFIIYNLLTYLFYREMFGSLWARSVVGLVTIGVAIFMPVWGTVSFKRESGGQLTFKEAFISSLIICMIGSVCFSGMAYIIPNFIDTDYPAQISHFMQESTREAMEKFNQSDDKIEEAIGYIREEDFRPSLLKTIQGIGIGLIVNSVLSAIIALFVSRKRKQDLPTIDNAPPAS